MQPPAVPPASPTRALKALVVLALIVFAKFAEVVLLPVAVALVLTFVLSPLVRGMRRLGVADGLGAAVVVGGLVMLMGVMLSTLTGPAAAWWEKAPQGIQQLIDRAEDWRRTVPFLAPSAPRPATVRGAPPPSDPVKEKIASESVAFTGALLLRVANGGIFIAATLILLFFLLASERWLVSRTVQAVPQRRRRFTIIGAVRDAQRDIATFLTTQALINVGVAIATGLACWAIGLPNPILWAALAGIMSFIPYLGPILVLITLFLAGALTFEQPAQWLLPPMAFGAINLIESNFVTPWVVGRRLELSPLAVFLAVMFTGWLWGIAGAFIAVPMLVALRSVARRSKSLRVWVTYLDRGRDEPPSMRHLLGLRRRPRPAATAPDRLETTARQASGPLR